MSPTRPLPMLPLLLIGTLLVVVVSWLSSLPMQADFKDLVVESAYLEDPSGRETIETIGSKRFTPFTGPLFRGNNQKPLWLKLRLAKASSPDWVLMLQPNFVHHVDVWAPDAQGNWRHAVTGIKHSFKSREVPILVPSVRVQANPDSETVVYARVMSPTTPIFARVLSFEDAQAFDSILYMVAGLATGIGLLMGLVSFTVYLMTRDSLWLMDSGFNFVGILVLTIQLGLFSRLVAPESRDIVNQLSMYGHVAYVSLTALVYYRIFGLFVVPKWLTWPNLVVPVAGCGMVWMIANGYGDKAMALNNLLVSLLTVIGVLVAILVRHNDKSLLLAFRFFYAFVLAYFLWWSVSVVLQQQMNNTSALYPGLPVALFSMVMLILILVRNTQLKIQLTLHAERHKLRAERELAQSRRRYEETSSFYGMLLHEVKNPLSTIRMAVSNLQNSFADQGEAVQKRLKRVQDSVDQVDEVIKRGVAIDTLEQGALVMEYKNCRIASLIERACREHSAVRRLLLELDSTIEASVDEHLFHLMLNNLVDNAEKYSQPDSFIELVLRRGPNVSEFVGSYVVAVRNKVGEAGLPDPAKVFKKYYRSPAAERQNGMGLGLYWVRGVARKMGGDAVYDHDNDKVVFKLCMPI